MEQIIYNKVINNAKESKNDESFKNLWKDKEFRKTLDKIYPKIESKDLVRLWFQNRLTKEELKDKGTIDYFLTFMPKDIEVRYSDIQKVFKVPVPKKVIELPKINYIKMNILYKIFDVNMKAIPLSYLFDLIECNKDKPLIILESIFYKLFRGFKPQITWVTTRYDDELIIYILTNIIRRKEELIYNYEKIKINKNGGVIIDWTNNFLFKYEEVNKIIENIFVGDEVRSELIKFKNIDASFIFIGKKFLNYSIIADLFMNNKKVRGLEIVETTIITRDQELALPFFVDVEIIGEKIQRQRIKCTVEQFSATIQDILNNKELKDLKIGEKYLLIKMIKVKDTNYIKICQKKIIEMINLYEKSYDSMIIEYRSILGESYGKIKEDINIQKKLRLKDISPELFYSNNFVREGKIGKTNIKRTLYSTLCQKKVQPIIITADNEKEYNNIYKFPKSAHVRHTITTFDKNRYCQNIPSNMIQYEYGCKDDYMLGVRQRRVIKNSDSYSCIPCCYKKSSKTKDNSLIEYNKDDHTKEINVYIEKDEKMKINKTKCDPYHKNFLKSSERLLKPGNMGSAPKNIVNLINIFSKGETIAIRFGANPGINSFLSCIQIALNKQVNNKT